MDRRLNKRFRVVGNVIIALKNHVIIQIETRRCGVQFTGGPKIFPSNEIISYAPIRKRNSLNPLEVI